MCPKKVQLPHNNLTFLTTCVTAAIDQGINEAREREYHVESQPTERLHRHA